MFNVVVKICYHCMYVSCVHNAFWVLIWARRWTGLWLWSFVGCFGFWESENWPL